MSAAERVDRDAFYRNRDAPTANRSFVIGYEAEERFAMHHGADPA